MASVEMISFTAGQVPQYPDCPYAKGHIHFWGLPSSPDRIRIVQCQHPKSFYIPCTTNNWKGLCPSELKGPSAAEMDEL